MTRITEQSSAYPGGVRKTSITTASRFSDSGHILGAVVGISTRWEEQDYRAGGIVPEGGSIELAYEDEADGGAGEADLDTGDEARDRGPADEPAFERDDRPGEHW